MKTGVELRKIVTIIEWNELTEHISEDEAFKFTYMYTPSDDCYVEFSYTPFGFDVELPELENVLENTFKVARSELILLHMCF